jgi:hypothetical protein
MLNIEDFKEAGKQMAINLHNGVDSFGVLDFAYEILAL